MSDRKVTSTRLDTRLGVCARRRKASRAPEAGQSCRDDRVPEQWIARLGKALGDLEDRSALNQNPLAHLAYVERLATERYRGFILPRGLALRSILLACVDKVCTQLVDESGLAKPCKYLQLRASGHTCKQTSEEIGLTREHVSRTVRRKALELLAEEFLSTVNGGREVAKMSS